MTLYYKRVGERDNPTLLLLHSGGMTHEEWTPHFTSLSAEFDIIAPDLPGHGKSRLAKDETISISNFSDKVLELLGGLNIRSAHVIGSSTGAAIALYMAIHHAELINKLGIYRMSYRKEETAFDETKRISNPEYWESYGMANYMSKLHLGQSDNSEEAKSAWKSVIANIPKLFDPETTDHKYSLNDLAKIKNETLLVAGDRDPLISVNTLVEMYHAIPDSAMWIMPNASHVTATNTWRAKHFGEELTRFLRS